jgi:phosphoribosylaminoimidazole carboxylase
MKVLVSTKSGIRVPCTHLNKHSSRQTPHRKVFPIDGLPQSKRNTYYGNRDREEQQNCLRVFATAEDDGPHAIAEGGRPRSTVIGILGGGQLGKMLSQEASKMGLAVKVLDPTAGCPASSVAEHVSGSFASGEDVKQFAAGVDILTVEIEHVDTDALEAVEASGVEVQPAPGTVKVIQDKFLQKEHFSEYGVPLPEFMKINCEKCAATAGEKYGYPFMLKSRRLAYDGRGNAVVGSEEDLDSAVSSLGGYEKGLYAEKMVPFVCELAVMVVRSRDGSVESFPVVQTIHKDNICLTTEAPACVPNAILAVAQEAAEKAIGCLKGAGVFGVELFLLEDGSVLLNEVAPRPHNSGHYTIEACGMSQYEAHLRAILGWPMGDTDLKVGCSIMLNILGKGQGDAGMRAAHTLMGRAYATPGASVHWYGKEGVAPQRKIGHVTIIGDDRATCRERLQRIDSETYQLMESSTPDSSVFPTPEVGIIMGSDSDLPTMKAAAEIMDEFGVRCEITVVSAHRTPERMMEYAKTAHERGLKAIIAGAGGAAHLPEMVAAMTPLPVIGVPVIPANAKLDGMDALLSIVQMPKGVPVATVAIGNAANAGLLAVRILASSDKKLLAKMMQYQLGMKEMVLGKAERLETKGWRDY